VVEKKMQHAFRPLAAYLIWGLVALADSSWAGPVQEGQVLEGADQLSIPGLAVGATAVGAEPAASASALAAEIIKEAEAGSHPGEQAHHAKAAALNHAASAAGTRTKKSADEDNMNLREIGKAAVLWVKSSLPGQDDEDAKKVEVRETDANPILFLDTATTGDGKSTSRARPDSDANVVRIAIHFIREVIEHPMTWLVVSLVIVGGIVAKKIDRRPTD
jgi:hypothetical protein